jgi:hypothetical protein
MEDFNKTHKKFLKLKNKYVKYIFKINVDNP